MESKKRTVKTAGLIYVIMAIIGAFVILHVSLKLIVWSDANTTFKNITESEALYRFGIVIGFLANVLFLVLPLCYTDRLNG